MKSYRKDHPRPQLLRETYELLNGEWDFKFDDENVGEKENWYQGFKAQQKIIVPFTYETKMSGIGDDKHIHEYVWYQRTVHLTKEWIVNNTVLHFEGSDYITKVWINGQYVGMHEGGYARFSFDISNLLEEGSNQIIVKIEDPMDMSILRGKQRWTDENYECWYVQTTGIWKTVWIENVNQCGIEALKITPSIEDKCVILEGSIKNCNTDVLYAIIDISFAELEIAQVTTRIKGKRFYIKVDVFSEMMTWGMKLWSPQEPNLYDLSISIHDEKGELDKIYSYFGMREIAIEGQNILLNRKPIYQRLILDQGYWEDSHLTPPCEEALIEDIDKIFALGYNGIRKHQKIEDERFLYWCDVKGMLVWSEMAANYRYCDDSVEAFVKQWIEIVRQNYNHPSIIIWTPINESWGVPDIKIDYQQQKFSESIYNITKSIDKMRPVIVNDGWQHTISDIITLHDYEEVGSKFVERYENKEKIVTNEIYHNIDWCAMAEHYKYQGQPIILSEYGGIAFDNRDEGWGYGNKVRTEEEFVKRFADITDAIKSIPYICGYCYTQVTDVQQEINGLMDAKRNFKVSSKLIKQINKR